MRCYLYVCGAEADILTLRELNSFAQKVILICTAFAVIRMLQDHGSKHRVPKLSNILFRSVMPSSTLMLRWPILKTTWSFMCSRRAGPLIHTDQYQTDTHWSHSPCGCHQSLPQNNQECHIVLILASMQNSYIINVIKFTRSLHITEKLCFASVCSLLQPESMSWKNLETSGFSTGRFVKI